MPGSCNLLRLGDGKAAGRILSYTRFDDHHDRGAISKFRVRLANAVRAVTGEAFEIFQDVDGIGLGEKWPGKLDQILDEARFFIPIITPNFFSSKACRDELEKFLKAEKDRGGTTSSCRFTTSIVASSRIPRYGKRILWLR